VGDFYPKIKAAVPAMGGSSILRQRLLVVVVFLISKPVHFIDFQRAIVFVQFSFDLDVMSLVLSYRLRVLDAVPLFVLVIFHHIIVAILPNISRDIGISHAMRRLGLLIMLVLSDRTGRANHREN
jgi:hypothetical protein